MLPLSIGKVSREAQRNKNVTALTQLGRLKLEKEALNVAKEITKKAKAEAMEKVEQLLKEKTDLKQLHTVVETKLNKV